MGQRVRAPRVTATQRRGASPVALVVALAGAASIALAQDAERLPARSPADVAVSRVEALAAEPVPTEGADRLALARLALDMAGPGAIEPLIARLDAAAAAGGAQAQAFAWALGECLARAAPAPRLRARAVAALRRAAWASDWGLRVSAVSALGVAEAHEAEMDLVALSVVASGLGDEVSAPRGRDGAILLALAGVSGDVARAVVNDALRAGGDVSWARGMMALHARLGASCWPDVVSALEESPREDVRTVAAAALLMLAEPASACRVAEAYGREPSVAIRLTLIQVLAATASPIGRGALAAIAAGETDPGLARAAGILARETEASGLLLDARIDSTRVREALASLARAPAFPRDLRDIESGATQADLRDLDRTLRRLPLREDGAWIDDHARLAQVRARLLCATWQDGIPQGQPRVGRPARLSPP